VITDREVEKEKTAAGLRATRYQQRADGTLKKKTKEEVQDRSFFNRGSSEAFIGGEKGRNELTLGTYFNTPDRTRKEGLRQTAFSAPTTYLPLPSNILTPIKKKVQ
jgi:hypothetical protein